MCLFKKFKKLKRRRLQRKFAEVQSKMEEIERLYGCTQKDEIAIADYLLLNSSGDVSKLLDNGCDPAILEKFRTTGILNIPPNVSKDNCYGKYCVTSRGLELLELTTNLDLLSH